MPKVIKLFRPESWFPCSIAFKAATAIAGAVFLPTGSRIMESGFTFIALNCSATMNLCSSLQTTTGSEISSTPFSLRSVFWRRVLSSTRFISCLGYSSLDRGQSLVPEPPASITGVIINIPFFIEHRLVQMHYMLSVSYFFFILDKKAKKTSTYHSLNGLGSS